MDDYTADAFANRGDPIPVINFEDEEDLSGDDYTEVDTKDGKREKVKRHLSGKMSDAKGKVSDGRTRLQDRLLET